MIYKVSQVAKNPFVGSCTAGRCSGRQVPNTLRGVSGRRKAWGMHIPTARGRKRTDDFQCFFSIKVNVLLFQMAWRKFVTVKIRVWAIHIRTSHMIFPLLAATGPPGVANGPTMFNGVFPSKSMFYYSKWLCKQIATVKIRVGAFCRFT